MVGSGMWRTIMGWFWKFLGGGGSGNGGGEA
jgi:hypothetical protein